MTTIDTPYNRYSLELQILAAVGRPASAITAVHPLRGSGVTFRGTFAGVQNSVTVNSYGRDKRITVNDERADKRDAITAVMSVNSLGLVVLTDIIAPIGHD